MAVLWALPRDFRTILYYVHKYQRSWLFEECPFSWRYLIVTNQFISTEWAFINNGEVKNIHISGCSKTMLCFNDEWYRSCFVSVSSGSINVCTICCAKIICNFYHHLLSTIYNLHPDEVVINVNVKFNYIRILPVTLQWRHISVMACQITDTTAICSSICYG